ncbi:hypothetical protein EniyanLRS_2 [Mycobacterium phage EniyanLRS]|uniref:Uncharacterized protein n=1 Tax=Mycobacterium phage EniyanLRS TaxID=1933770 RepID=A0A2H4GST1_9CAUD|nr:hypothetical protein EniyanLRS_2 [Mycobacterium phage EniyanLRS]
MKRSEKLALQQAVHYEKRDLIAEKMGLEGEIRHCTNRLKEINDRLAELETAENLLEGM